jgi:recombination protein RecA
MAKQTFSPDSSEKEKTIDLAISSIEKQFGKGSIMRLGAGAPIPQLSVISSGSIGLDIGLGVGDTQGRIIEIFGPESRARRRSRSTSQRKPTRRAESAACRRRARARPRTTRRTRVKIDDPLYRSPTSGSRP